VARGVRPIDKAIVGLGNPGLQYRRTRHNVGFMVVDALARDASCRINRPGFDAKKRLLPLRGRNVLLVKPMTYMNESGRSVRQLIEGGHVDRDDVLIVLDDLALDLGTLRLRARGSAGSHNGLASVLQALDAGEIARLRLGIGPAPEDNWRDFVLSPFASSEYDTLDAMIRQACEACMRWIEHGLEAAMSAFNTSRRQPPHDWPCVQDK